MDLLWKHPILRNINQKLILVLLGLVNLAPPQVGFPCIVSKTAAPPAKRPVGLRKPGVGPPSVAGKVPKKAQKNVRLMFCGFSI